MFRISIDSEEIDSLEVVSFPGNICVIDSEGTEFDRAIRYLKHQKVIGFDTESKPVFTPDQHHNGTALLQLSGGTRAFLFRVKSLGMPAKLRNILSSHTHIKVGAAVHDDVLGLRRIADFVPRAFVDLQKIVWEYGIKDKSVKKMAAIIMGVKISKKEQLSNWEAEELSPQQCAYAATDAWICREMYRKLQNSEKNPLTSEQMAPNPPHNPVSNG